MLVPSLVVLTVMGGLAFPIQQANAAGTIYYVDNTITDTHVASATPDCTNYDPVAFTCGGGSASAYATIADINASTFQPDDQILFRKGQTWREQLTVPSSGTSGHPITFGAFGSGVAPIVGGNVVPTEESGGVFASGFEDETSLFTTDFGGKTVNGSNAVTITSTAGEFHSGTKAMKVVMDGSTNKNAYITKTIAAQTSGYIRFYFKIKSGYAMPAAYQAVQLFQAYSGATLITMAVLQEGDDANSFNMQFIRNKPTNVSMYSGYPTNEITKDSWHYIEVYFSAAGTGANGTLTFWLDGVQKATIANLNLSAYAIDSIRIGQNGANYNATNGSTLLIDSVKVGSTYNGAENLAPFNYGIDFNSKNYIAASNINVDGPLERL